MILFGCIDKGIEKSGISENLMFFSGLAVKFQYAQIFGDVDLILSMCVRA